jgi:ABC-type multidrug transport system permease subunit
MQPGFIFLALALYGVVLSGSLLSERNVPPMVTYALLFGTTPILISGLVTKAPPKNTVNTVQIGVVVLAIAVFLFSDMYRLPPLIFYAFLLTSAILLFYGFIAKELPEEPPETSLGDEEDNGDGATALLGIILIRAANLSYTGPPGVLRY